MQKKIFLLCLLSLVYASQAQATDIQVSTNIDNIQNDGLCSLREAVFSANQDVSVMVNPLPGECASGNGPDVILLPFNTYTLALRGLNEEAGLNGDLDIMDSVTIKGTDANRKSIIDGANVDRIFHVVRPAGNETKKIRFENLTLSHGNPGMGSGGALLALFGDINVVNCLIWENQAQTGGGISTLTNLTVTTSRIEANTASLGGGIAATAALKINNSEVLDNIATNFAGGLYSAGSLDMDNSFVYSNSSNKDAGGIKLLGDVNNPPRNSIVRTNIFSNHAGAAGVTGNGGGIHIQGALLNMDLSSVYANVAQEGGGIYNDGTLNINTSTLSGNSSMDNEHNGGGLFNKTNTTLLNVSIIGNQAQNGGGFFNAVGGSLAMRNTLLFSNTVKLNGPDCSGRIISNDYNLLANAVTCRLEAPGSHSPAPHDVLGGFDNAAPLIKVTDLTLRFNGGPTKTHALEQASAAINAGSCTSVDGVRLESDQRGYPKGIIVQNGRLFLRDECDIGAYELGAEAIQAQILALPNLDQLTICGDAIVNGNEACDDGNFVDDDACNNLCEINQNVPQPQAAAVCGNTQVEAGEGCDDGNVADGDGCSAQCLIENPVCGNSQVEGIETCDDGNILAGDGCDASCQIEANPGANSNNSGGGCSLIKNDIEKNKVGFYFYAIILLLVARRRFRHKFL